MGKKKKKLCYSVVTLRVNTVLQTLDLSHNDLGDVGGKAVGEALGGAPDP